MMFKLITKLCALLIVVVMGLLIITFIWRTLPTLTGEGFGFIWGLNWNPVTNQFGALTAILGTIITAAIAIVIAVPFSFCIAVLLTEMLPEKLSAFFARVIELMAAIPSIIYGMWGLFFFAPFMALYVQPWLIPVMKPIPVLNFVFGGLPIGVGILTAGIILAIMILPLVTSVMRELFASSPYLLREAGYSLGATRREVIMKILLPHTKNGVLGAVILGLGRALGETMAVTFVIGNSHSVFQGLFMPGTTISATIASEFQEAFGTLYPSALLELGLILFVMSFIILAISRFLINSGKRG